MPPPVLAGAPPGAGWFQVWTSRSTSRRTSIS